MRAFVAREYLVLPSFSALVEDHLETSLFERVFRAVYLHSGRFNDGSRGPTISSGCEPPEKAAYGLPAGASTTTALEPFECYASASTSSVPVDGRDMWRSSFGVPRVEFGCLAETDEVF